MLRTMHETAQISGPNVAGQEEILTPEALRFLAELARRFEPRRKELLARREQRQAELDAGKLPDFLPETADIRRSDWKVAPIPPELADRRVEITGPVDRKMIINAMNSGANVFMADFEDSNSPTWENNIGGQVNLRDAIRRTITFESPEGKQYKLNEEVALIFVRPRGWHLIERHCQVDDEPISGSLFDFGLYFFHNAPLFKAGTAQRPCFYLPKMESYLEARLWNDVFHFAQDYLHIAHGTIRATVLIETILAAFEMDEILFWLRDHSAGLNCGRWDYIFSYIKKFRNNPAFLLPDRAQVTMDKDFLAAYVQLLIETCHRRGIHAMGGMAAQIPIKSDPAANEAALEKVRQDKLREVTAGHDGTWVAHPGLVGIAKAIFDAHMPTPNQIDKLPGASVTQADLLRPTKGTITEAGLRLNLNVGIRYLEAWLVGNGCVPINNLMEDAATAEICRSQIWQWRKHGAKLDDGRSITADLIREFMADEFHKITGAAGPEKYYTRRFATAGELFEEMLTDDEFQEFLTLRAYDFVD
ncbi:MAG: malate synthase A [Bryobacteraceae bacterium]